MGYPRREGWLDEVATREYRESDLAGWRGPSDSGLRATRTPAPGATASADTTPNAAEAVRLVIQPNSHRAPGELEPGTMVGEYKIEAKVGHGAMGVVYGAVHPVIGKRAAVKVMRSFLSKSPEALERFVQEARAVGRIGHPNIVDAFAFGKLPDGRSYFTMEWLKGRSLTSLIEAGPMGILDVLDIVEQVCRGLEAAHAQGIIHRDLKPDNVFLKELQESPPIVKILDFSIAKLAEEDGSRQHKTLTGVMIGTPAYVSPEQVKGGAIDERADTYALGVMTFEMLTGRLPFPPGNRMALLNMHLAEAPPTASSLRPDIPPALDALVASMLQKAPADRPSTREIRAIVGELRGDGRVTPAPVAAKTPVPTGDSNAAQAGFSPLVFSVPASVSPDLPVTAPIPTPPPLALPPFASEPSGLVDVMPTSPRWRVGLRNRRLQLVLATVIPVVIFAWVAMGRTDDPVVTPTLSPIPGSPEPRPVLEPNVARRAAPATLVISVDVEDATIWVDGRMVGDRVRRLSVTVDDPGRHQIEIASPGRPTYQQTVELAAGVTFEVAAALEKPRTPEPAAEPEPEPEPEPVMATIPEPAVLARPHVRLPSLEITRGSPQISRNKLPERRSERVARPRWSHADEERPVKRVRRSGRRRGSADEDGTIDPYPTRRR